VPCAKEVAFVFVFLILRSVRTIVFARTRAWCEIVFKEIGFILDERMESDVAAMVKAKICSYRGGYQAAVRRKLENGLFCDSYLGVVATSALEVGIDIGSMGALLFTKFETLSWQLT
jgi:DEAD/DEAH box helicase domain-containing protein